MLFNLHELELSDTQRCWTLDDLQYNETTYFTITPKIFNFNYQDSPKFYDNAVSFKMRIAIDSKTREIKDLKQKFIENQINKNDKTGQKLS